ncbi:MAG: glycoside hydrolase family 3 protein [Promethearchaeota archaeon]
MENSRIRLDAPPFNLDAGQRSWVEETMEKMNTEKKIGQLLAYQSYMPFKRSLKGILKYHPGGVFLGMGLFSTKGRLQGAARFLQDHSEIPLLIAGDLEFGGFGAARDATAFSSQLGVAATDDILHARRMGTVVGREASAMGFNWTFSPVADINKNHENPIVNIRSFGDDENRVARMVEAYIEAVQEEGVAATAKHWPGDGLDNRDQHLVTTHNTYDWESWKNTFGMIYRRAIAKNVLSIMSAHITLQSYVEKFHPAMVDEQYFPASMSKLLNEDLLRGEMGFNGLIVSDATGMRGLTSHGPRDELLPRIVENGIDVVLFTHGARGDDFNRLLHGFETGIISKKRLIDANYRILGMKAALGLHVKKERGTLVPAKGDLLSVKSEEHLKWARECAKKSITLVKDTQHALPISPDRHKRVAIVLREDLGLPITFFVKKFPKLLAKRGYEITICKKGDSISSRDFDLGIYVVAEPGFMGKNTLRLNWRGKKAMRWFPPDIPSIFISLANPYHLYEMPTLKTVINAYAPFIIIQEEIVKALHGEIPFTGTNPVDPFCGLGDARI